MNVFAFTAHGGRRDKHQSGNFDEQVDTGRQLPNNAAGRDSLIASSMTSERYVKITNHDAYISSRCWRPVRLRADRVAKVKEPLEISQGDRKNIRSGRQTTPQKRSEVGKRIVSAVRPLTSGTNVIQNDTAINEGNSGGPMYNSEGEVISVATFGPAVSEIENLGFGLPTGIAEKFLDGVNIEYSSRITGGSEND